MEKLENKLKKGWVIAIVALFCNLLWGSAFPCVKISYELFGVGASDTASRILLAGCRFTLAGIMVVLAGSLLQKKFLKPRMKSMPNLIKLAIVQTVIQYFFFYVGMANTTGVKGAIIEGSSVFLAILFSALIFRLEKLSGRKILGCILGFAGVTLVNLGGGGLGGGFNLTGDGFVLISAAAYALSSVMIKMYSKDDDTVMLAGYQFILGGIVMIIAGLVMGGRLVPSGASAIGLLIYMAFISAGAYTLWGVLLKYNPVSRVTIYGFTNPVFGVILSAIILGEGGAFTFKTAAALVLVCIGIIAVNRVKQKNSKVS